MKGSAFTKGKMEDVPPQGIGGRKQEESKLEPTFLLRNVRKNVRKYHQKDC